MENPTLDLKVKDILGREFSHISKGGTVELLKAVHLAESEE